MVDAPVTKDAPVGLQIEGMIGPIDISNESERTYEYWEAQEDGRIVSFCKHIKEPWWLWIKPKEGRTGSHRIMDAKGRVHYAKEAWDWLSWIPKDVSKAVEF